MVNKLVAPTPLRSDLEVIFEAVPLQPDPHLLCLLLDSSERADCDHIIGHSAHCIGTL